MQTLTREVAFRRARPIVPKERRDGGLDTPCERLRVHIVCGRPVDGDVVRDASGDGSRCVGRIEDVDEEVALFRSNHPVVGTMSLG